MKKIYFLLLLSISIFSCQENSESQNSESQKVEINDPNPFETALYNCLLKQYAEQNMDLAEIHQQLENLAIRTGNLENSSPQAYYNMFKLSASAKHFPLKQEQLFFEELAQIPNFPLNLNCNGDLGVPDAVAKTSKMSQYNRLLSKEISNTRSKGIQPNTAIPIINTYSAEDFDNKFIQLSMLAFISHRTSIENKIYE